MMQGRARDGVRHGCQFLKGALSHNPAAMDAGSRPHVHNVVRTLHGVFIMFHDQQGIAPALEFIQCTQQQFVVPRMQADGGFIQHVKHAAQVGAQLGCQADALGFPAGKRRGAAVQGEVAQPHPLEEVEALRDFRHHVTGNESFLPFKFPSLTSSAAATAGREAISPGVTP